jgi:hypothetical protein
MSDTGTHRLLLISDALPADARLWGDGGWCMPEEREALDWLTLARLLGWQVDVIRPGRLTGLKAAHWIVVACDGARLSDSDVARLERRLATAPGLLVARAVATGCPLERLVGRAGDPAASRARVLTWPRADGSTGRHLLKKPLPHVALPPSLSLPLKGGGNAAAPPQLSRNSSRSGATGSSLPSPASPATMQWRRSRRERDRVRGEAPEANVWARIGNDPLVTLRSVGRGSVATLAVHPSVLRDASGAGTALLTDLLIRAAGRPVAWLDWQGTVALRMDDPGAAQNVWLESWTYAKLGAPAWEEIGAILARHQARLSIAYVSGWVDDGDPARGSLTVAGQSVGTKKLPRLPGQIYPSPDVVYVDRHGHSPGTRHDGPSEYKGIQALRQRGLAEVELHGHTHMHPDTAAWAKAPDRYTGVAWFREVSRAALPVLTRRGARHHPFTRGRAALKRQFKTAPLAVVSPGDEFTDEAMEQALDLGIALVSSYYTAIRHEDRFAWSTHLCAPYLDEPDAAWFAGNLPVVGYFHDRDLAVHGNGWLDRNLAAWRAAGATRFIDFRELVAALDLILGVRRTRDGIAVAVERGDIPLPRPARISLYDPDGGVEVLAGPIGPAAVTGRAGNTVTVSVGP